MPKKALAPQAPEPVEVDPLMGRPTLYDPAYTRAVQFMCRAGATDVDLADFFDVTVRTINRWKVTHPEFAAAMKRGKEAADDRVEDSLYHRAMGTEYEEAHPIKLKEVEYSDGKRVKETERVEVVMVKKVIPADTTAAIFWLKNRRKSDWRDVHQHEHGRPGDFEDLSDDQLIELIVEETGKLQLPAPVPAEPERKRGSRTKH